MFSLKSFLSLEVKPALGCTEPGAVALGVARAHRELVSAPEDTFAEIIVSDNILKNGMAVGIPGANGAKGNNIAAALALICGNPDYGLEVLRDCTPEDVARAVKLVAKNHIQLECDSEKQGVYVHVTLKNGPDWSRCLITGHHSNIVLVERNGLPVYLENSSASSHLETSLESLQSHLTNLTFSELIGLAEEADAEDIDYLWNGIAMNLAIANYALNSRTEYGLNVGSRIAQLISDGLLPDDLSHRIKSLCCAASDARMAGVQMPVMSSGGSGNHGITAILPIYLVGTALGKNRIQIAKATAVSHLVTSLVKSKTGRLTPVCGCSAAAGAGAAAGLTYLQAGSLAQVAKAAQTLLSSTVGMICDGAKESCSLKVGTAASEAYLASVLSLHGVGVASPQGVVGDTIEETTDNIGVINRIGMKSMDEVLIQILQSRNKILVD